MDLDTRSILTALLRAELAVGVTLARGAASYAEITLKHGANAAGALAHGLQSLNPAGPSTWEQAGARVLTGYRDYLREVSALASLMSLAVFDNIEQLRGAEQSKHRDGVPHSPPGTSSLESTLNRAKKLGTKAS